MILELTLVQAYPNVDTSLGTLQNYNLNLTHIDVQTVDT